MSAAATATERTEKSYAAKMDSSLAAERSVVAIITTGAIDRDREVVRPDGLDWTNYIKNPVVLYQHAGWSTPVGKCNWLRRDPVTGGIKAKIQFYKSELAQDLYDMYVSGFMSAFSIGFLTKEGSHPSPDEIKMNPALADCRFIHRKTELLEFSCVTIPCNPDAVVTEKSIRSDQIRSLYAEAIKSATDPDNDGDDDSTPEGDTDNDGGSPIKSGHYVEWGHGRAGGCGKVKSIHKAGKVPGVENTCECTEDAPAARVRCYKAKDGGGYMATKRHLGMGLKELTRIEHDMDGADDEPEENEEPVKPKKAPVVTPKAVEPQPEPELPSLPPHRSLGQIEATVIAQVKALFDPQAIASQAARAVYETQAGYV